MNAHPCAGDRRAFSRALSVIFTRDARVDETAAQDWYEVQSAGCSGDVNGLQRAMLYGGSLK
jgi:hypothetical protein